MGVFRRIFNRLKFYFLLFLGICLILVAGSNQSKGELPNSNLVGELNSDSINILNDVFDIPELTIIPSPASMQHFTFAQSEKVIDYDVSPAGITVAAIIRESDEKCIVKFWKIGETNLTDSLLLPDGIKAKAITWHPNAKVLFVMGEKNGIYQILRIEKDNKNWDTKSIFSSPNQLRRLVVCPRPFIIKSGEKTSDTYYSYRIFFGMDNGDKSYRTVSVTELGKCLYQVIGPVATATKFEENDVPPSEMTAGWALPIAFHPAGHQLIWEDKNNNYFMARYNSPSRSKQTAR